MKHTIKLLTLAFMLATIFTLTGCPGPVNTETPCTHENKKTVIETAATCTETGLEKIICADCGELIEEKTIEALGHDFGEWTVTKEATCTADGEETRTCKREGCTHSETRSIEKHHTWELESDTATCATDGIKTYKCSRCNETRTEDSPAHHTFIAGGCDKCGTYQYADGIKFHLYVTTQEKFDNRTRSNDIWDDYYLSFNASTYSELIERYGNLFEMVERRDDMGEWGEECKIPLDKLLSLKGINNDFTWYFPSNESNTPDTETLPPEPKDAFCSLDDSAVNIKEYYIVTTN